MTTARTLAAEVAEAIAATLSTLHAADGAIWEIRAPRMGRRGTVSGYYNDPERCARDVVTQLDGRAPAVYVTLNAIKPALLARAKNRLQDHAEHTTADADVTRRLWLPFDFDPERPVGISASDAEHAAGLARAAEVASFLADLGWAEPIRADSGNGGHLLYRIDLEADDASRTLVERVLLAIAHGFDETTDPAAPLVHLDTSVGNAARIWKVYGTVAGKGDHAPDLDRPHRRSRVLSAPHTPGVVTREQLIDLCAFLAPPAASASALNGHQRSAGTAGADWIADAGDYLRAHGIEVLSERDATNARKWLLRACVWNPDHTDHSAWVMQFTGSKTIAAGCSHHSCQGKRWPDFRDAVEPGWRERRSGDGHTSQRAAHTFQERPESGGDEETQPADEPVASSEESAPAFPLHVLPQRVQTFITTVADAVGCPPDLVAVPALVAAGAAIGNAVELEVKPGWHERACLWTHVIARSGDGKSPAYREAMRPLLRRQDTLFATYRTALAAWHAAREGEEKAGPKPVAEHAAITDSTLEALALALVASPRGLILALDEAASWVLSFNQYRAGGRGADRPHWLKIWAGEQDTIIRATREPVHLPAPFVAVSGNMPPDKLSALADVDGAEDGFIARILFSYPVPLPARASKKGISTDVRDGWEQVIGNLLKLTPTAPGNGEKGVPMLPATARFAPRARPVWQAWEQKLADEMNSERFPDAFRACWSKFKGYTARLALLVNALAWACDEPGADAFSVCTGSVEGAVELAEYFQAHARRVYAFLNANAATREALGVLEWLRRHHKVSVTARDVQQARLRGISDVTSATLALQRLASMGYGTCETTAERGGKRIVFTRR